MNGEIPRGSKWGKVGTVIVVTLSLGLLAAGLAYTNTDIPSSASKYHNNYMTAKAAGAVFSRTDALAMRQVPSSENAYLLLRTFLKKIDALHVDVSRVETSDCGFLDEWKPFEKYLPTILVASNRKYLMVENDLNDPDNASLNEPILLSKWTEAMCWLADIAAKKSDLRTTSELLLAAARLSTMLKCDPDFEAIQIRSEMAMVIDHELSFLITAHGGDSAWQTLIEQVLSILAQPYDFRPSYKYAHWLTLYKVQLELGEIRDPSISAPLDPNRLIPRFNKATMSRVHELYGKMLEQYPSDLGNYAKITELNKKLFDSEDYHLMSLSSFYYSLSDYSGKIWRVRFEEARRNTVIQALAIKKGNLDPSNGLPVKGRHSFDLDGKLLRIKKLPKGWVIYSVGNDGRKRYDADWVVHLTK
jgi:hypothetical protein